MKVTITAVFDEAEKGVRAQVFAKLKDLGIEVQSGDADGRQWISVQGVTDEGGLLEIVNVLNSME